MTFAALLLATALPAAASAPLESAAAGAEAAFRRAAHPSERVNRYVPPPGRRLTEGEVAMTTTVFRGALDPSTVRVHQRKYWPFQDAKLPMSPDGHVYYPPGSELYREDFSHIPASWESRQFLHELAHVWQRQQGVDLRTRRLLEGGNYRYLDLPEDAPFLDYGVEQQAEMLADYARILLGGWARDASLERRVAPFIADPGFLRRALSERRAAVPPPGGF